MLTRALTESSTALQRRLEKNWKHDIRMAAYKSMLIGARVATAGRKRKCYHSKKHQIVKGDTILEVRERLRWQGYCAECAEKMVALSTQELCELRKELAT